MVTPFFHWRYRLLPYLIGNNHSINAENDGWTLASGKFCPSFITTQHKKTCEVPNFRYSRTLVQCERQKNLRESEPVGSNSRRFTPARFALRMHFKIQKSHAGATFVHETGIMLLRMGTPKTYGAISMISCGANSPVRRLAKLIAVVCGVVRAKL